MIHTARVSMSSVGQFQVARRAPAVAAVVKRNPDAQPDAIVGKSASAQKGNVCTFAVINAQDAVPLTQSVSAWFKARPEVALLAQTNVSSQSVQRLLS